jgi:hypothetical protein
LLAGTFIEKPDLVAHRFQANLPGLGLPEGADL